MLVLPRINTTTKGAPGACMGRALRGVLTGVGCIAVLGMGAVLVVIVVAIAALSSGGGEGDASDAAQSDDPDAIRAEAAELNEPVDVADVTWEVTNAEQTDRLKSPIERRRGNFVVVDFNFTNNSDEPVTLDSASLAVLDGEGRTFETDPETSTSFVPTRLDPFLDSVNPGVSQPGRVIFTVAPDAEDLVLQAGDTDMISDEEGYVNLGL